MTFGAGSGGITIVDTDVSAKEGDIDAYDDTLVCVDKNEQHLLWLKQMVVLMVVFQMIHQLLLLIVVVGGFFIFFV